MQSKDDDMITKKYYNNPIIPGFYPDPSICRVGEDYYLVNSSFEYFPAIPVWHSKDLVHWEQIGNAIDREEQGLNLDVNISGGVQACTIRYHEGTFYITSTCVGRVWPSLEYNFIITAKDPRGPWSEVHYIKDAPGIDSSLFFDDDGKAYYQGNRQTPGQPDLGVAELWIQEINLETFELVGEKTVLWDGCMGQFPEGPHIYKRNGHYYLMIAEGGTGHWHTVTMAVADHIRGPYIASPRNPILSHKHLSKSYPIQNVGHADLVETQNHQWYMVCLGVRPRGEFQEPSKDQFMSEGGFYINLGRETFLVPVKWEDDISPIVSPESGRVELMHQFPELEEKVFEKSPEESGFGEEKPGLQWNTIRDQKQKFIQFMGSNHIRMELKQHNITEDLDSGFYGRRQTSWKYDAETEVELFSEKDAEAGMTCYFNYMSHIRIFVRKHADQKEILLVRREGNQDKVLEKIKTNVARMAFKVEARDLIYTFYYKTNTCWQKIGKDVDGSHLNSTVGGGHTGSFVGVYGYAPEKGQYAEFKNFSYTV